MAFQGTPQPDLIGLALNLMQMRRDNELQDRKMRLEEAQIQMARDEAMRERSRHDEFASAVATGDPQAMEQALARFDPAGYAKLKLSPKKDGGNAQLDWEYDKAGNKRRAIVAEDGSMSPVPGAQWVAPRPPISVNVGGDGLNPYQTAQTRQQIIAKHEKASEPYVAASGRLNELQGILSAIGDREPTPFESEAAATAFAKGLKPAEAVMRDDIARILGQGFSNQVKGFLNLPQRASRAQIQQMADALSKIVSVAELRQRRIDEKYRGLGSDYKVEIPTFVTPTERQAKPRGSENQQQGPKSSAFADRPLTRSEYDVAVKSILASGRYKSEADIPDSEVTEMVAQRRSKSPGRTGRMGDR